MIKKIVSVAVASSLLLGAFAACDKKPSVENGKITKDTSGVSGAGKNKVQIIGYLNFRPEAAEAYNKISAAYEKETGVKLVVETAAAETYETELKTRAAAKEAPTLFHIMGPRDRASAPERCADLKDSRIYKILKDKSLALSLDGGVYGVPYGVEGYGFLYNKKILDGYFALPDRATAINGVDDIRDFRTFKAVVEDMQKRKSELGIKGVFASSPLKAGGDYRRYTRLTNILAALELKNKNAVLSDEDLKNADFVCSDAYKNILDLYLNNSTTDKKDLGSVDAISSAAEFALEKCAVIQSDGRSAPRILDVAGAKVAPEDIKLIPIYAGVPGEENFGVCVGAENFICINAKASKEEQKAADDFLYWLFSSKTGRKFVVEELGLIAPFNTFGPDEAPDDPTAKETARFMSRSDSIILPWNLIAFPSGRYGDKLGAALLKYARGVSTWDDVKKIAADEWKEEFGA